LDERNLEIGERWRGAEDRQIAGVLRDVGTVENECMEVNVRLKR